MLKRFGNSVPERIMAMPKISSPSRPLRAVLSEPQMAEQLVEVPTVVSPFFQFVQQNADIPVPGARGVPGYGGLQGFLPEQSSHPSDEQTIDIPVPWRGGSGSGGLHGFHPRQGCSALLSRSLTFLFPVEVLMIFSLILVWQLHPQFRVMSWVEDFFGLFPVPKKSAHSGRKVSAELGGHVSSSTLGAHQMAREDGSRLGKVIWRPPWAIGRGW